MPPLLPIKELSSDELAERERNLRKLREELRSEEMKLVLLKKLRQSQQLKENIAAVPKAVNKLPPPVTVQPVPHRYFSIQIDILNNALNVLSGKVVRANKYKTTIDIILQIYGRRKPHGKNQITRNS